MRAGALRHRIVIEAPEETRDDYGTPVATWREVAVRPASIEPFQGQEFLESRQLQTAVDHRIRLRSDAVVASTTPKMRIRFGTRLFDIESVLNPDGRNVELVVMAREQR